MKAWFYNLKNKHKNIAAKRITFYRVLFFSERMCVAFEQPRKRSRIMGRSFWTNTGDEEKSKKMADDAE